MKRTTQYYDPEIIIQNFQNVKEVIDLREDNEILILYSKKEKEDHQEIPKPSSLPPSPKPSPPPSSSPKPPPPSPLSLKPSPPKPSPSSSPKPPPSPSPKPSPSPSPSSSPKPPPLPSPKPSPPSSSPSPLSLKPSPPKPSPPSSSPSPKPSPLPSPPNQTKKTKQLTLNALVPFKLEVITPKIKKVESPLTTHLLDGGTIHFWPNFLSQDQAREIFDLINNTTHFIQSDIKVRGKVYKSPRLQSWMADKDVMRKASLYLNTEPVPWSQEIQKIRTDIEALCNFKFDYLLINLYRNGNDHIGFHSDREAIEESKSTIASFSVGATRKFVVKHHWKDIQKIEYSLTPGSLLVMSGPMQKFWKHSVPKQAKVKDARINFTFRKS